MNLFLIVQRKIIATLAQLAHEGVLPTVLSFDHITCEPPREEKFGDMATNAAMVLAKPAGLTPLALATHIATRLQDDADIESAEVAAPGFVNLRLKTRVWQAHLQTILSLQTAYGDSALGQGQSVNVEYVSANPTGPMHAGHARIAVVGDVLANLLIKAGFSVTKEYYCNDAGSQIETLARSLHIRYREVLGESVGTIPEGFYPGEYLIPVARALVERDGPQWQNAPEEVWLEIFGDFAVAEMMKLIREDLALLGVYHDVFTSEKALIRTGKVDQSIDDLEAQELVYVGTLEPPKGMLPDDWEPRPQLLFRATHFGDDVDRPLKKSDGNWTYFASDIAYHLDKHQRGSAQLINVWGADHGGYIKRTAAAVKAISRNTAHLDVVICQLVNLLNGGEALRMSKRSGNFISLKEVVEAVGKDVVRFIMLTRKNDMSLEFDFAKVTEQSKDNPVFYVNYAHARACSVRRQAEKLHPLSPLGDVSGLNFELLTDDQEIKTIKKLAQWPRLIELAARLREPHRIAFYLYDLAAEFHILWHKGKEEATMRFIVHDHVALTQARLALVSAIQSVIASGLHVFGVTPLEEMH